MKRVLLFLLVCVVLLSACSSPEPIDESDDFRVGVLYEHTVLMIQYSTPEEIEAIGLVAEYITDSEFISTDEKIERLAQAYNTTNTDITHLEDIMVEMMDKWANVTNTLNNPNSE